MAHTVIGGGLMQKLVIVKSLSILDAKEMLTILERTKNVKTIVVTQEVNHNAFKVLHSLMQMAILLFVVDQQQLLAQHVLQIIIVFMMEQHMVAVQHKVFKTFFFIFTLNLITIHNL